MKSVWLIHNNIPPYRVPLFAEIAKESDFDFRVVLTTPQCKHRPHWKATAEAVPFKILTMKGLNLALSDSSSVSISLGLLPSLIHRRPDIVICSGLGLSTLMVFVYSRLFSKKYIVWSEATEITERLRQKSRLRRWMRGILACNASAFVDAGKLSREYLLSLLPRDFKAPFFRSYNCVNESAFSSRSANFPRLNRRANPSCRKILFVGRLNMNKGVPTLLEAYRSLVELTDNPTDLVLVGEGPLEEYIREFKRNANLEGIHLEGQVSYCEIARYYQTCSVFVLLSRSDCNPLTIFEALHAGIPIVCTDRAGNAPDFIVPGENGYIVDPEDKDSIVHCLLNVINWDASKRASCALTSKKQVAKANYRDSAAAFLQACETALKT